jgi:hypothetical protein
MLLRSPVVQMTFNFILRLRGWLLVYVFMTIIFHFSSITRFVRPISPATLIYAPQDAFLSLLLSPFLLPHHRAMYSRILHIAWLSASPPLTPHGLSQTSVSPGRLTRIYLYLLFVRSVTGFLLTRSVGWTYPSLFNPHALYEQIYGIGPLLVGSVLFDRATVSRPIIGPYIHVTSTSDKERSAAARIIMLGLSSMIDELPWTYLCAAGLEGISRLCEFVCQFLSRHFRSGNVEDDPGRLSQLFFTSFCDYEDPVELPLSSPHPRANTKALQSKKTVPVYIVALTLVAMAVSWVCGETHSIIQAGVSRFYVHHTDTDIVAVDARSGSSSPDLHIIMLTYPRERDLTDDFMITNIQSYVDAWIELPPPLRPKTTLTIYGHVSPSRRHPAFARAKAVFSTILPSNATSLHPEFYMHPHNETQPPSHYAHLADALRYAYAAGHEWTMVVEDDFVLCGTWGMEGVARLLNALSSTLVINDKDMRAFGGEIVNDNWPMDKRKPAKWRGAFVGTGGRWVYLSNMSTSDGF